MYNAVGNGNRKHACTMQDAHNLLNAVIYMQTHNDLHLAIQYKSM